MLVLLKSGQSVPRERDVEEMKERRSTVHPWCRSTVHPWCRSMARREEILQSPPGTP
ncbi:hypothetical protein YC2023_019808 [Brassica napus]